jgi:undecaprenyl diphosphate synthase
MASDTSTSTVPSHVAIVMDGNGRWAWQRSMPRIMGHKAGVDALVDVVRAASKRGIRYLTVFAFSSENWKRPAEEVSGLMGLLLMALSKHLDQLKDEGVRFRVAGDLNQVSEEVRAALLEAQATSGANEKLVFTVAFNYGGRWDIVQACQRAIAAGVAPEALDEATLSRFMTMSYAPDPDLVIRTGGEIRLSNFLLWQSAYAELYFTECLWPDFDAAELDRAIASFVQRERRFGDVGASGVGEGAVGGLDDVLVAQQEN